MFEESVWASMNSWLTPAVFFVLLNVVIGTIAFTSTLAHKKQNQDSQTDSQQHNHQQQKLAGSSSPLLQRLKSINFSGSFRSHESTPSSLKLHPKKTTDSEPLFNFEPTSQSQNYEMQSHYVSSSQNQEKQGSFDENPREMQGHYFFEQNPSEISNGHEESFAYQRNHQLKSPEIRPRREIKMQEDVVSRSENVEEIQRVVVEEEEVYSQPTEQHIIRSISDTKPTAGEIPRKLPAKMKKSASLKSAFNHFEAEDIQEARRPATVKEMSSKAADVDNEVDSKADDFINKFKQQLKLQRLDSIIRYKEMIGKGKGGGG